MNAPARLGAFGAGLAVVFTAALGLGRLAGPAAPPAAPAAHDRHNEPAPAGATAALPAGLQITQDGYRLQPISATLAVGDAQPFRFRILGPDDRPVTDYTVNHDKDLHLIVVRRDLSDFQHVHPERAADGTWSIPLAVGTPGQYRVFADFQPAAREDGLTLGADVPAPGDYRPRPLPPAERSTTVDGYTVTLTGDLVPGGSSRLTLSVSRDGAPVTDLQPYLGAYGHLVALRAGDLAYLHVHPDGEPGDGRTAAGPGIVFHADVPSAGDYRLYLDFQHDGTVRTAAFTATAGPAQAVPDPPAASPAPAGPTALPSATGHGDDGHTHG
ncbi:hypothetical protein Aph02nite_94110 [Actinoplanes philippinensis]|uniref:Secreted protein n=1 Tax=Actinoplanes philippinensis TaxID=35752 RepID=A0A1I2N6L4_9ACTN|nr:hypothetical protein [Actinoplanes philippinensis]GIE83461.1 hypothetical protein Aph02nite_94110 [Actinoplanes philippinensis]SFF99585.1 hypothetical protein SAMN05421541_1403 [Actinoplanes philippinensis]